MPALNFHPRFAEKIRGGLKTQTIREDKHGRITVGCKLYLYTGMRQATCAPILEIFVRCKWLEPISIELNADVYIGAHKLTRSEVLALALADGFTSELDFYQFFAPRLPFKGKIIYWT